VWTLFTEALASPLLNPHQHRRKGFALHAVRYLGVGRCYSALKCLLIMFIVSVSDENYGIFNRNDSEKDRNDSILNRNDSVKNRNDSILNGNDSVKNRNDSILNRNDSVKNRNDSVNQ